MNNMTEFNHKYNQYLHIVEEWLKTNIPKNKQEGVEAPAAVKAAENTIFDAMEYSLMSGGKRIRPVLSLAVCDVLKGSRDMVLPFASAIELIHTYSLIHDDLPCMDDDDFRRGRPTNHKVFGEPLAVLAGDGLLNLAFEIMLDEVLKNSTSNCNRVKTAHMIAKASGVGGMIGGQVIDILSEGSELSYDELCSLHQKKTGALFSASVLAPALLLAVDKEVYNQLYIYAKNIGLAFQIKDDILDIEGDSQIVGKAMGSDASNKKVTYVSLLGIEKAKELLGETIKAALEAISTLPDNKFLGEVAIFIGDRNK